MNIRGVDFERAARAEFAFLAASPYSLRLTGVEADSLRFDGNGVAVSISLDPLSYELEAVVWHPNDRGEAVRPYTVSDLIRATDADAAKRYRSYAATTSRGLIRGLSILASDLQRYGRRALADDASFYRLLAERRRDAAEDFGRERVAAAARRRAESAWRDKDYHRVALALGEIEHLLSPAERKKLSIARARLEEPDAAPPPRGIR